MPTEEAILPQPEPEPEPQPEPEPEAVPRYVQLNVGGTPFTTLLSTLLRHPDSMLATMFGGLAEPGASRFERFGWSRC